MTEFEQMNTFFIIASVGFVIFIFFGILIGFYLTKLLKKLNTIADEAKLVAEDVHKATENIKDDINGARAVIHNLFSVIKKKKKTKK